MQSILDFMYEGEAQIQDKDLDSFIHTAQARVLYFCFCCQ